jgi:hypothetical protein
MSGGGFTARCRTSKASDGLKCSFPFYFYCSVVGFVERASEPLLLRLCECAEPSLIAGNEKLSLFVLRSHFVILCQN